MSTPRHRFVVRCRAEEGAGGAAERRTAPCRPSARRVLTIRQKIPLICALAETTAVTSTVSTAPSPVAR